MSIINKILGTKTEIKTKSPKQKEKAMKLIENITDDEIRINIQRQANNLYDQTATKSAIEELITEGRVVKNMTGRSFTKMQSVIKREAEILDAVRDKIQMFRELCEEYSAEHEGEDTSEYGIDDMMTEASAENSTN